MGSSNFSFCDFSESVKHAYILGLWCADGYHRTSSIGLSSIDEDLIKIFSNFLSTLLGHDRLRLRVYHSKLKNLNMTLPVILKTDKISHLISRKSRHTAFHIYVNCRALLREFMTAKLSSKEFLDQDRAWAYLAGRFDGDGSVDKNLRNDLRIVYSNEDDAIKDFEVIKSLGLQMSKIYRYRTSNTYCLYISRYESKIFLDNIEKHSKKLQKLQKLKFEPRRDLAEMPYSNTR